MSGVFDLLTTPIEDGVTVIEASAGTGKTYCLTGLVLRALLEGRVEHAGQLLVVTFTNAATDELVGRIRSTLASARAVLAGEAAPPDDFLAAMAERHGFRQGAGDEILRQALLDIDDLTVATIHGFCKRVLDEAAFEGGLPFEASLVEDDDAIWLDAARDVWRRLLASPEISAGDGILPILIAERGLEPESFRLDFRRWQRHPGTELIPPPLPVDEAAEQLAAARRAAGSSFDRARWRLGLSRLELRGELADARRLREVLAAADDFLRGRSDGLWAVQLLDPAILRSALARGEQAAVDRLPGIADLETLFASLGAAVHALRGHVLVELEHRFSAAKKSAATLAFDDLLHQLRGALHHPVHGPRLRAAVRSRYRLALVDEFQDTDLVQYDIFRRLFGDGPLILVGDPKQAIYRFRGADVFAYLSAKRDADRTFTLNRNWRSSQGLVSAVNAVFGEAESPFALDDIPFPLASPSPTAAGRRLAGDDQKALVWLWQSREKQAARGQQRIATAVARQVAGLLAAGLELEHDGDGAQAAESRPLRPADIAVLVRTNEQARLIQDRLREVGVPAVLSRTGDIFRSDELEEVIRLLHAVLEPSDGGRLRAACSTVLWGDDAAKLRLLGDDDALFQRQVERFERYRQTWQQQGFIVMMETLLRERGVRQRLGGLERGERRLTNLQHTVELAHQASHDHHLSPAGLLGWLRAEQSLASHQRDAAELRLESDAAAVQLVTVHKSKGLEYEVVFCPFLWQARPISEPPVLVHETADRLVYDCGSPHLARHLGMADAERLAEDLRLLYVALTRARRRCYVVWGAIGRGPMSARSGLAYLLHRRQRDLDREPRQDDATTDVARRVAAGLAEAADRQDSWYDDLRRRVASYPDVMALEELGEDGSAPPFADATAGDGPLEAARWSAASSVRAWRIASFSSLARGGGGQEVPDHGDPASPAAPSAAPPRGFFAFARGPRAGNCLHKILEEVDFTTGTGVEAAEIVRRQLERFRLEDAARHARGRETAAALDPAEAVLSMLQKVLGNTMPGGLRLADVPRSERLVEWQFYAPLAATEPAALAGLFDCHATAPWAESYVQRLSTLDSSRVEGFLTGYVDVVIEHGGRWFVVDWKSNHLGDRFEDYDQQAMTRAMIDHHYLLQAHLYALALDRFLRLHQPGWDFARHFGGAYYIFLRGVDLGDESPRDAGGTPSQLDLFASAPPDQLPPAVTSSATGIFHLQPEPALIEALGATLVDGRGLP